MGYWVEGSVEGEYLLDIQVSFLLQSVETPVPDVEYLERELEDSPLGDYVSGLAGLDWEAPQILQVEIVRQEGPPGDLEQLAGAHGNDWDEPGPYISDYKVVVSFDDVPVPFTWSKFNAKLTCIGQDAAWEARSHVRKALREVYQQLAGLHGDAKVNLIRASVTGTFTGVGEDGQAFSAVGIDGSILQGSRRFHSAT